ncbi:hypothetical protein ACA910_002725 [Epithemia clementina (nom. ined.)]
MKVQRQYMLLCLLPCAAAYSTSSARTFVAKRSAVESPVASVVETRLSEDKVDLRTLQNLEQMFQHKNHVLSTSIEEEEARHGMPWKESISADYEGDELLYMSFWDWHLGFMKQNLNNLRLRSCSNGKTDFSYNENKEKKARIVNLCLSSDEYRKIRLTYYDAGDNTQVYNAVLYPDPKYNLPILGIDLLAFNRKKYLTIVDFQPLHSEEVDHATTFEDKLKPIKEKYDALKGRMSSKFYDETQFFSQQMLFARFEDESVISRELFPAFQEYVKTHLDLINDTEANSSNADYVLGRQEAYDTYSAERDPATGLFAAMFGNDWAQDFVHDFLFSMSERQEGFTPAVPNGGRPQPGAAPR